MKIAKWVGVALFMLFAAGRGDGADRVEFRWWPPVESLRNASNELIGAQDATVLTFLSTDATIDFDTSAMLRDVYGNDFFLHAQPNGLAGRYVTGYSVYEDMGYVGTYAYAVVLDLPFASFSSLAAVPQGTRFGVSLMDGPLDQVDDVPPPQTPARQSLDGGMIVTSHTLIPEPGAMALVVLGGAAIIGFRRRRARNL